MSGRQDGAIVTVHCPRCGRSFLMRIEPLRVGHAVDVAAAGCGGDLDEDAYMARADRAVGAYESGEREG